MGALSCRRVVRSAKGVLTRDSAAPAAAPARSASEGCSWLLRKPSERGGGGSGGESGERRGVKKGRRERLMKTECSRGHP